MDFKLEVTQVVHLGKVWKRFRKPGGLGWTLVDVAPYVIDDPTPQVVTKGDVYINDCKDNNEAGDIIISRGGMGKAKRVHVRLLSKDEFIAGVKSGTIV